MSSKKLILVIGATGAQGRAVVDKLLAPAGDGTPSPYAVRALTRDPTNAAAQALHAQGVQLVQGSFMDLPRVAMALRGAYGAFVNTDGFSVSEASEIWAGIRIFELAREAGTVRHYVWSSIDCLYKLGGYDPQYKTDHADAKGRVADWIKAQPSTPTEDGMSWTIETTVPYMDMLKLHMFGPMRMRADGTYVFALPIGPTGRVPLLSLSDLGFFARYTFDHRVPTSGQDLHPLSDIVTGASLAATFTLVTGKPAVFAPQTLDAWFANFRDPDAPLAAAEKKKGDGSTTWRENFSGWWATYRDDVLAPTKDLAWSRRVHPNGHTLESWMRENEYDG
ncbi:NAD-P-binding protein, partial [Amylostereum chailletii]